MQNQPIVEDLAKSNKLLTPPRVELIELKNLFFQLCSKTCNLKCKYCYIKKNPYKTEEDFIDLDKIKHSLNCVKNLNLNSIYLTGGEPLMHPDFNKILRMCLKISNTTILSNGVMINDKKVRFLRKIDDESNFETIFRISLDSTDEIENDLIRGRGSFRKALCAIFSLLKYEFNPIISVVNYKNRPENEIFSEFSDYFSKKGFILDDINLKIIPFFKKDEDIKTVETLDLSNCNLNFSPDCKTSRTVSQNGVFSCPIMVGDYRKRLGSNLEDFSRVNYLDCEKCSICIKTNKKALINSWM